MGNIITNWARRQNVGHGGAKAVLLCLADFARDYDRGRVKISQEAIAEIIEFDRRSVIRWLQKLEGSFIKTLRSRKDDGTNNLNQYQIICPPEIFSGAGETLEDRMTDSHPATSEDPPFSAKSSPVEVTVSHPAPSGSRSHETVFKEEELLKIKQPSAEIEREPAGTAAVDAAPNTDLETRRLLSLEPIAVFFEIFPSAHLSHERLAAFAARLPAVEAAIWRQNLLDWRDAGWKPGNIPAIIDRYEKQVSQRRPSTKNFYRPDVKQTSSFTTRATNADKISEWEDYIAHRTGNPV